MKYRVLAADDETELLDALELYTERENISLIKTDNGITALELFRSEKPHLVLLDIMMPGLDGFSVLKKIRSESSVPAIMLTARDEDYDKILGLELGADDYITKPYNPMVVVAIITTLIRALFFFDRLFKNLSVLGRSIGMVICCVAVIVVFVVVFGWFPAGNTLAWLLFALSFGVCFTVSLWITLSRQKRENEAMAEALERLKRE